MPLILWILLNRSSICDIDHSSINPIKETDNPFQIRQIRAKMIEIMQKEVSSGDLRDVCNKLIPDSIGRDIEKACSFIYPLQDVHVRKVKILKKPRFEGTYISP